MEVVLLLLSWTPVFYFFVIRNTLCLHFRKKTRNMFYIANLKRILKNEPVIECKFPEYFSMVFSFKRLRLESYFSKKTIELVLQNQ